MQHPRRNLDDPCLRVRVSLTRSTERAVLNSCGQTCLTNPSQHRTQSELHVGVGMRPFGNCNGSSIGLSDGWIRQVLIPPVSDILPESADRPASGDPGKPLPGACERNYSNGKIVITLLRHPQGQLAVAVDRGQPLGDHRCDVYHSSELNKADAVKIARNFRLDFPSRRERYLLCLARQTSSSISRRIVTVPLPTTICPRHQLPSNSRSVFDGRGF